LRAKSFEISNISCQDQDQDFFKNMTKTMILFFVLEVSQD